MSDRRIEWDVAEVIEYDYTYQYIPNDQDNATVDQLFALKVRSCSTYFNDKLSKFSKTIGFEYLKNLIGNDGNVYQINVRSL